MVQGGSEQAYLPSAAVNVVQTEGKDVVVSSYAAGNWYDRGHTAKSGDKQGIDKAQMRQWRQGAENTKAHKGVGKPDAKSVKDKKALFTYPQYGSKPFYQVGNGTHVLLTELAPVPEAKY